MVAARLLHASMCVDDLDRSIGFYSSAFGYQPSLAPVDVGDEISKMTGKLNLKARLAQLAKDGDDAVIELIEVKDQPGVADGALPRAHVAFAVQNLPDALKSVATHGAMQMGEIVTFEEGRSAYCKEPGGSVFELEELY